MDSAAWRHASLRARAILLELVKRHNGYNNGKIGMSQREMSVAIGSASFGTVAKATAELIQHGFVDLAWEGEAWARKAREFRITWLPTGEPPHLKPATDDWRAFSGATTGIAAKAVPATAGVAGHKFPATAVVAARDRKRLKTVDQPNGAATPVSAHIDKPYGGAQPAAQRLPDGVFDLFDLDGLPVSKWPDLIEDEPLRARVIETLGEPEPGRSTSGSPSFRVAAFSDHVGLPPDWIWAWLYEREGMFQVHLNRVREVLGAATD